MKKLPSLLLTVILLSSAYTLPSNSQSCSKYRIGTYYCHFNTSEGLTHYRIIRDDSTQTEINENDGNITKLSVKWLNDCSYEMRFKEGTEVLSKDLLDLKKKMILKTTIVSGNDKYYLFKSTSNLSNHEFQDTIWFTK